MSIVMITTNICALLYHNVYHVFNFSTPHHLFHIPNSGSYVGNLILLLL